MPNDVERDDEPSVEKLGPLARLNRDLREAAASLGDAQAAYMVTTYYSLQDERKAMDERWKALRARQEPYLVMNHIAGLAATLEGQIKTTLDTYSAAHPVGAWARSICGIGPVIAAGLLAWAPARSTTLLYGLTLEDIEQPTAFIAKVATAKKILANADENTTIEYADAKAIMENYEALPKWGKTDFAAKISAYKTTPGISFEQVKKGVEIVRTRQYAGNLFAFAGIDGNPAPERQWKPGEVRPWNANLKVLCFKIGESFVKVSNRNEDIYGRLWRRRKEKEIALNEAGAFAPQAAAILAEKNISKSSELRKHLQAGRLSPAHIHARARRFAVKMFLSHWHEASYVATFGKLPPEPYAFAKLGHKDFIVAPHMHLIDGWEKLRREPLE